MFYPTIPCYLSYPHLLLGLRMGGGVGAVSSDGLKTRCLYLHTLKHLDVIHAQKKT